MGATTKIELPAVITIKNTSDHTIRFIPYRENFATAVAAGDTLEIEAQTAGQVLYYIAQQTDGLEVTQAKKGE